MRKVVTIEKEVFFTYDEKQIKKEYFGYIYVTKNIIEDKFYIGMCSSWRSNYFGSGTYLKRAIKKHGIENFKKVIIDVADSFEELAEKEIKYIRKFNAASSDRWYNIKNEKQLSGMDLTGMSKKDYEKHCESCRIRATGRKASDETKRRMSISQTGRRHTEESKMKMSIVQKKIKRTISNEQRELMKEKTFGMKQPNKSYWFDIYDNHGVFVGRYTSISECNQKLGINSSTLKRMRDSGEPVNWRSKKFKGYTMVPDENHNQSIYKVSKETSLKMSKAKKGNSKSFCWKIRLIDSFGNDLGVFESIEDCKNKTGIHSRTLQKLRQGWEPTEKSKFYNWKVETLGEGSSAILNLPELAEEKSE